MPYPQLINFPTYLTTCAAESCQIATCLLLSKSPCRFPEYFETSFNHKLTNPVSFFHMICFLIIRVCVPQCYSYFTSVVPINHHGATWYHNSFLACQARPVVYFQMET